MSLNKILSLVASIIKSTILFLLIFFHPNISSEETTQYNPNDQGVLSIMYHRFNENKYPSTNIKMDVFKKHLQLIKNNNVESFVDKSEFKKILNQCCNKKELDLITKKIDCIINNKNTYKYLLNNANKIMPSKKSVIDILFKMF